MQTEETRTDQSRPAAGLQDNKCSSSPPAAHPVSASITNNHFAGWSEDLEWTTAPRWFRKHQNLKAEAAGEPLKVWTFWSCWFTDVQPVVLLLVVVVSSGTFRNLQIFTSCFRFTVQSGDEDKSSVSLPGPTEPSFRLNQARFCLVWHWEQNSGVEPSLTRGDPSIFWRFHLKSSAAKTSFQGDPLPFGSYKSDLTFLGVSVLLSCSGSL